MADSSSISTNLSTNATITGQVATVINWLTFGIGLPAIALAMYALKNMSRGDNKVPMHVVLLLVSDVVGFFSRPTVNQTTDSGSFLSSSGTDFLFYFGIISNVTLMLVIAQEHHLRLAYPQCLGCFGTVRRSPVAALLLWAAPFAVLSLVLLGYNMWFAMALLSPFPFLLFFALDSWRALICSRSDPVRAERRRAAWGVAAIWANYTLFYSPFALSILLEALSFQEVVSYVGLVSHLLLYLSPLLDPFLYLFLTKGVKEVLQAMPCCPSPARKDATSPTVQTVAETVETKL